MPIFGWIRDLLGIHKDVYETKKTRLEIEKIEDEKRRKIIFPATFDDIKKYDPTYRAIHARVRAEEDDLANNKIAPLPCPPTPWRVRGLVKMLLWALVLLLLLVITILVRR
jgi:hypothetical protein